MTQSQIAALISSRSTYSSFPPNTALHSFFVRTKRLVSHDFRVAQKGLIRASCAQPGRCNTSLGRYIGIAYTAQVLPPEGLWNSHSHGQATKIRWLLRIGNAVDQFLILTKTVHINVQQFDLVCGLPCHRQCTCTFDPTHVRVQLQGHRLVGDMKMRVPREILAILPLQKQSLET